MYKSTSPPLVTLFLAVLALVAIGAASLHADDVPITATVDASGTLNSSPPSTLANLGTTTTSATYSTAIPAGIAPRKSAFAIQTSATWDLQPTLANTGGYKVYVSKGTTASCPTTITVDVTAVSGCALYDTNGNAATTVNTPYFQSAFLNNWYPVCIITNTANNPQIHFAFHSGSATLSSSSRWYMDEVRFQSLDPCAGVASQPGVTGPLAAGSNYVVVTSVVTNATNITVYANLTTPIGSTNKANAFGSASVKVWLDPGNTLNRGDTITATVIATNSAGNACTSAAALSGPIVGSGGPKMIISLGCQKNTALTGPIGTATPSPGTDTLYWVKATGTANGGSATAPVGGYEVLPSECWQTLTFNWQTDPCLAWLGDAGYTETNAFCVLESLAIGIDGNDPDSGPYDVYIDKIMNGTNVLADFENHTNGTPNINLANANAPSTPSAGNFLSNPMSTTTSTNAAFSGTNSCRIQFQFVDNSNIRWARIYMNQAPLIYPQLDTHKPVTMSVLVLPPHVDFPHQFTGTLSGVTGNSPAYTTGTNTLAVAVSGPGPYTYQWSFTPVGGGGGQIFGATDASYSAGNVDGGLASSDSGLYTVEVNDGTCPIDVSADLTVQDPIPVITNQLPASVIEHPGDNLTLSIGATAGVVGGYPLSYQWEYNGVSIDGATDSSFTTNNVQVANIGSYDVIVANSFLPAGVTSVVAVLDVVQPGTVAGTGTGLEGYYYNNTNFFGTPALTRLDPVVDFNWGAGSPDPSIQVDDFCARWYGQLQALDTDTYTFYVNADDGVRLWVNNQLLIDSWILSGGAQRTATMALTANQKYPVVMEYYEHTVSAQVHLRWTTTNGVNMGVVYEAIPASQLYAGTFTAPTVTLTPASGSVFSPVTLTATVVTNTAAQISSVQFFTNNVLLASAPTTPPYAYAWTAPAAGTYNVFAQVQYDKSTYVYSATNALNVSLAPPKSSVTISDIINNLNGTFTINYGGGGGASFTLMKSAVVPNPTRDSWTAVGANQPSTPGSFTVTPAPTETNLFYTIRSN